ncbi:MAG: elongation factor P maturation arginine rhamnosyltransferase EarP [Fusobacteriaceae bacterium]
MSNKKNIDIFCEIIDNFGDVGVVYRLAKALKNKKYCVRVFLSRTEELSLMDKNFDKNLQQQNVDEIKYLSYKYLEENILDIKPAEIIIEAFGCKINEKYFDIAKENSKILINLEYLSSEDWVKDFHGQESPLGSAKMKKYFLFPGFSKETGGVICSENFSDKDKLEGKFSGENNMLLNILLKNILPDIKLPENFLLGTIFSYEKNFENLLDSLNKLDQNVLLLVMGDKSQKSFQNIFKEKIEKNFKCGKIYIAFLDFLLQEEYDALLSSSDFNFVRGEDSFTQATLAGVPFLWHAYLQDDMTHLKKISGFCKRYREYFEGYHEGEFLSELKIFEKLILDYNFRAKNSFEKSNENYDEFFKSLENFKIMNELFSKYIRENCNLVEKLCEFIEQKIK